MLGIFALQFSRPVLDSPHHVSPSEMPIITSNTIALIFKCCFGYIGAFLFDLMLNGALIRSEMSLL